MDDRARPAASDTDRTLPRRSSLPVKLIPWLVVACAVLIIATTVVTLGRSLGLWQPDTRIVTVICEKGKTRCQTLPIEVER